MSCLSFYVFIIIQCYVVSFYVTSAHKFDTQWDLPTQKHLYKYLGAVQSISDYSVRHRDSTDLNLAFGLFLSNVNMGHALKIKEGTLPINVKKKIMNIIAENNGGLNLFQQSTIYENNSTMLECSKLFNNVSYWQGKLEKFVYIEEKQYKPGALEEMYSPFNLYMSKVYDVYKWVPTPNSSDACLVSLSRNPTYMGRSSRTCRIANFCYDIVKRGTNFGYSLTHRIFILLIARLGRGCFFFSKQEDRALVKKLCSYSHAEAEYIAENNFALPDLLMEIVGLCTIDGNAQFLKSYWLDNFLKYQTREGCFAMEVQSKRRSGFWKKFRRFDNPPPEDCNVHTTGVAAVALSAAVRFIIEEYY